MAQNDEKVDLKWGLTPLQINMMKREVRKEVAAEILHALVPPVPPPNPKDDPLFITYEKICGIQGRDRTYLLPTGITSHQFKSGLMEIKIGPWKITMTLRQFFVLIAEGLTQALEEAKFGREEITRTDEPT